MANKKNTRRALLSSLMALLLCVSMLVGSTFAWFTDSVTSAGNKVVAGNLDVELYLWNDATTAEAISTKTEPIFGTAGLATDSTSTLWEPGKTQVVYFSVKNLGSLDLKYKVNIKVENPTDGKDLYEVMQYAITPDAQYGAVTAWDAANAKSVNLGVNTDSKDVALEAGMEHFFALSVHMMEEAGNDYQNGQVNFDIEVLATQLASEEDSFGADYDELSAYPGTGKVQAPAAGVSAVEAIATNLQGEKIATAVIPAEAVAAESEDIEIVIEESAYVGNFTVAAGNETKAVEITVTGLKENNDVPVTVEFFLGKGYDPATVKLYHYDDVIPCTYNPNDGYVTFESATFSPFTVVYDAESVYVPPVVDENSTTPKAVVTYEAQYVNATLPWKNYGSWSPTEGLEANLEAAFKFACPEKIDLAYEFWYCDFFVSLDKDLGENQIFLGGNYGDFGWIGFHNGDLTLAANTELPLLSSVTTNPWTYADVKNYVGEFLCGVGDVNDALKDATFTVKLRLINPEMVNTYNDQWWTNLSKDAYVDANVVTYTFGGSSVIDGTTVVTTAEGLQEAIDNGDSSISLGGDIDLNNGGIVIP